jgi:hypothetical protein
MIALGAPLAQALGKLRTEPSMDHRFGLGAVSDPELASGPVPASTSPSPSGLDLDADVNGLAEDGRGGLDSCSSLRTRNLAAV